LPSKGRSLLHVRIDEEFLRLIEIEARKHGVVCSTFVKAIVEVHLKRVGAVSHPTGELSEATLRKAIMARLKGLLGQLRFEIATLDVRKIREKRVKGLCRAIDDLSRVAKSRDPEQRLRYYQLLGYLSMVLDGLLNNVTKGELINRLEKVEARLDVGVEDSREASTEARK
jgi:hypothetical protein